jgi:molybdopterin converting factor small subunit
MPKITVRLPGVLAQVIGGERRVEVEANSIGEALAALIARQPTLGLHLYDEHGVLRRHVRCFCNEEYASERGGLDAPLFEGDTITLLNSVAGG